MPAPEKPRDVYMAACRALGKAFELDGFRFYKSDPHLTRRIDPISQTFQFWSSHHNEAGVYVELTVEVSCESRKFGTWIRALPVKQFARRFSDTLVIANLGRFLPEPRRLEWDVHDPATRAGTLQGVEQLMRDLALPVLDLIADGPRLMNELRQRPVPECDDRSAILYALYRDEPETAQAIARRVLASDPELAARVRALVREKASVEDALATEGRNGVLAALPLQFDTPID